MIATDANDSLRGHFRKPPIDIGKRPQFFALKAAIIATMNQYVAPRNNEFPMVAVRVGDEAQCCHLP